MRESSENLAGPTWNLPELLARVENDEELLRELVAIFNQEFRPLMQSLETAVAGNDLKSTAKLGHKLKGMLANLAAPRAAATAARLEDRALAGDQSAVTKQLDFLRRELANLLHELDAYVMEVRR